MRMISAAFAAALLTLLPPGAGARESSATSPDAAASACQAWDHGAAARQSGWTLTELKEAQRGALIRYYDQRVAPRADPASDGVVVASHPEWPLLRVIIFRGDCIIDIGQMGPDVLARILTLGTPV